MKARNAIIGFSLCLGLFAGSVFAADISPANTNDINAFDRLLLQNSNREQKNQVQQRLQAAPAERVKALSRERARQPQPVPTLNASSAAAARRALDRNKRGDDAPGAVPGEARSAVAPYVPQQPQPSPQ